MIPWSRPAFRWAGSKRALLPRLLACVPDSYLRYVEPFAGSACLFFALRPRIATIGDFNSELIDAYRALAKHPRRIARDVAKVPNTAKAYYAIRSLRPESMDENQRAVRFVYLNRHCFNGVYRTNRRNEFNVPRGDRPGRPLTEAEVYRCSVALRSARLLVADFEETLDSVRKDDFVYVDPPYYENDRPTYGEYGYGAFTTDDVDRLVGALKAITKRRANVLLSYKADSRVVSKLRGWSIASIRVRRQVAGGRKNVKCTEMLASNFSDLNAVLDSG